MTMETEPTDGPVKVILADDHPLIRQGLRTMLETSDQVEILAEACEGRELIEMVAAHQPDVVVVDIRMPDMDGLEAVRRIRKRHPHVKALMLTVHDEEAYVHEAIRAGASGYLLKTVSAEELVKGILTVAAGKAMLHPAITRHLINEFAEMSREDGRAAKELSPRERDVLQLLAYGKSNKEIAKSLGIGSQTVKTHISHIFTKLGAADRTGAVASALRKGLVE
ncbi:MAG TPA: response regulator transcription factor [Actinomycetota bacterium]|nr:response regulator transcription factor [Actinomycetota bacterium]